MINRAHNQKSFLPPCSDEKMNRIEKESRRDKYDKSQIDLLFLRVEDYMKDRKEYANSRYCRKDLVKAMGTNEIYLSEAIKRGAGMSIYEYIVYCRLRHAKELLIKDITSTIEQIAAEVGFGTVRNFYRAYKKEYGTTPSKDRTT